MYFHIFIYVKILFIFLIQNNCSFADSLKQAVGHEAIKLLVNVDEDDYETGRVKLLQNLNGWRRPFANGTSSSEGQQMCFNDRQRSCQIVRDSICTFTSQKRTHRTLWITLKIVIT